MSWIKSKLGIGHQYESKACRYLQRQGLQLLERNFRSKLGEIDLIMQDGQTIVFIEVKFRGHSHFGTPQETVTYAKQKKVIKTAHIWLMNNHLSVHQTDCRFDVIAINGQQQIEWLKAAFYEG